MKTIDEGTFHEFASVIVFNLETLRDMLRVDSDERQKVVGTLDFINDWMERHATNEGHSSAN